MCKYSKQYSHLNLKVQKVVRTKNRTFEIKVQENLLNACTWSFNLWFHKLKLQLLIFNNSTWKSILNV